MPFTPLKPNTAVGPTGATGSFTKLGTPPPAPPAFENPATLSNKKAAATTAATQAQAESKKANSPLGMASNFGKAVVSNVASSEVNLGQSLRKIFGNQGDTYLKSIETLNGANVDLIKEMRTLKAKGQDTSKLQGMLTENNRQLTDLHSGLDEENNLPTKGQVAGQLGGTALDVLAAGTYGKAAEGAKTFELAPKAITRSTLPQGVKQASQTPGLFTKAGAKAVGVGTGLGYAQDVTQGLQGNRGEDRTGAKALIPGLGTAIGAGVPLATGLVKSTQNRLSPEYGVNKTIEKRAAALEKLDGYGSVKKVTDNASAKGIDIRKTLAETDLLQGAVDKNGTINTGESIKKLNDFIRPQEDVISANLKKEGTTVPLGMVERDLNNAVNNSGLKGAAKIRALNNVKDEIAGLALDSKDGYIPLSTIHDAKVDKYANINYLNPESKRVDKMVANTYKTLVERRTKSVDVRKLNQELSKWFSVQSYLEKLDGKKVEGGRLGKYFAKGIGAVAGAHLGPLGSIGGAEIAGGIHGSIMKNAFNGSPLGPMQQSEAMTRAVESGKPTVIPMGGKVQSDIPLNTSQTKNMIPGNDNSHISTIISPKETYMQQGKRELGDIAKKTKDFIKNPKIGLSITQDTTHGISPEKVAKQVDGRDLGLIRDYLKTGSLKTYQRLQPVLEGMGIHTLDDKTQQRFLKEVMDLNTRKLPVKSGLANFLKGDKGRFVGSAKKT